MNKRLLLILLLFIVFATSCNIIKSVSMLNSSEVNSSVYSDGSRTVEFVEMIHVGKPEFYKNVKDKVFKSKQKTYVLFYEGLKKDVENDTLKIKLRKIIGFYPSTGFYKTSLNSLLKTNKYMAQNNDMFITSKDSIDFNIDISLNELISVYEEKFGRIQLSGEDFNIPLNNMINNKLPFSKTKKIIIDYRNLNLAKTVENSKYQNIIILYGALHHKGFVKELKKLNSKWKKIN